MLTCGRAAENSALSAYELQLSGEPFRTLAVSIHAAFGDGRIVAAIKAQASAPQACFVDNSRASVRPDVQSLDDVPSHQPRRHPRTSELVAEINSISAQIQRMMSQVDRVVARLAVGG